MRASVPDPNQSEPVEPAVPMGRYRPPQPRSSPYITAEGFALLQQELEALWGRRAVVTAALSAAAAEGDRSENAEYIYRKKELAGIDRRIRYLQKRLPLLTVAAAVPADTSRIFLGAWVELEDDAGEVHRYRIVGPDEFDRDPAYISLDAPLARALLKKARDEEVEVTTPQGKRTFYILDIRYPDPQETQAS